MMQRIHVQKRKVPIKLINRLPDCERSIAVLNGEVRFIDSTWQAKLANFGLSESADWSKLVPGQAVSESEITNCFKVELADRRCFFFKRYTYPASKQKRYWMRPSKAQVEVFGYAQLKKLGISTLNVIAFGEKRSFGKLVAAYIITEGIHNSMDLQQFAREVWFDLPKSERSEIYLNLRNQIFDQLNKAHRARFFHQDLHWRNILVTKENGEFKTIWIDCPRAVYRKLSINTKHGQMVDLSCLARRSLDYLSRSERYRALSAYLKINNLGWANRALFKEIQAHHIRSPNPPKSLNIEGRHKQFKPDVDSALD